MPLSLNEASVNEWTCEPSPAKFPTLQIQAKGVFLLAGGIWGDFAIVSILIFSILKIP